ncbi:MAG TPA: DUF393 domain-containing protein [Candidatus Binatia bacterium]|nr:DUF393 domain-containing protein [Candidatus Binatia bacterium]
MKQVIYDGSCKLCRITIDKAKKADAGKTLEFVDFTSQPLPPGMGREAAEKEIHVIDEKGRVHKNAEGIMELLEADPKRRWLARLGRLPVIRTLLRWGYRLVARYRHGHEHA